MLDFLRYRYIQDTAAGKPGPSLLPAGDYWANGEVSSAPVVGGNYTSTANLSDGSAGDQTTGETAFGIPEATITIISVEASAITPGSWALTLKYKGELTRAYSYWDGAAWQAITPDSGDTWTSHALSYAFETRTPVFGGDPSATIFRAVFTESVPDDGGMHCSDSRLAA